MPRPFLLAALLAAVLATGAPITRAAPTADPFLDIPVYSGFVGVRTAATTPPRVKVTAADGTLRADVTASGAAPADGHWYIELGVPGDFTRAVLLQPGDVVAVTAGGNTTSVTVPMMRAEVDPIAETVTGTVPPTAGVYLQLHRDPLWYSETDPAGQIGAVGAGGNFRFDLSGKFDLRAGTYGEFAWQDAASNIFISSFAVPAVTLNAGAYYAQLRANPSARNVVLSFEDAGGSTKFRATPAIPAGGALFIATLFPEGRPEYGIFTPEPGDIMVLTIDGQEALREPVPWLTATVDPAERAVAGLAPAGSRVAVTLFSSDQDGAPSASGVALAGADGTWQVTLPQLNLVAETATAAVVGYPGGGAAFAVGGKVPLQQVHLYGHKLGGTLPGWGKVVVEHRPADDRPVASADTRTDAVGTFTAELFFRGEPVTIMPGDRLVIRPEQGRGADLTVPRVTAEVDLAAKSVSGVAPPDAAVKVYSYAAEPNYFGNLQYEQDYTTLYARADSAGRYSVRCVAADCGTRYGVTGVRVGSADFALEWLDTPFLGVAVTLADAVAKATAGSLVTVTPYDAAGNPLAARQGLVRPDLAGGHPEWSAELGDVFSEPMKVGDRVRIAIGAQAAEVVVPALDWAVSPARDELRGQGPPVHAFVAIAVDRSGLREPAVGAASGVTDLAGRFQAPFSGFDVQPGDDADFYLLRTGHFLWWTAKGVRDPEPEASATPERVTWRVFLPWGVGTE